MPGRAPLSIPASRGLHDLALHPDDAFRQRAELLNRLPEKRVEKYFLLFVFFGVALGLLQHGGNVKKPRDHSRIEGLLTLAGETFPFRFICPYL